MDMDVLHYLSACGVDVFSGWFDGVTDLRARIAVHQRVNRAVAGNLGDHRFCRNGIWEMRIDAGPGYRVYFARLNSSTVLLFHGGDKRSQRKDITRAIQLLDDYRARTRTR